MANRLQGEVAIVTGGGRGIGKGIAQVFAREGAAVAVFARSRNQLDAVVAEIEAAGGQALAVTGDVTQPADVNAAVGTVKETFGPVTLMVNNAGVPGPFGPIGIVDPDDWWRAQEIHVRGPLLFMSAVLPDMRVRGGGRIINVASVAGTVVQAGMSAYCVGKGAEIALTQHVAAEGQADNIAAFAIEPGTITTDMADVTLSSPDAQRWIPEGIEYLRRVQETTDAAAALARCTDMCVDLASGEYDGLSGQYLEPTDDFDEKLREIEAG